MARVIGPGTILGGLPVIAEISCSYDDAEVKHIYWHNRDGTPGKPIPQHVFDRAEVYDPYLCGLMEQVFDYIGQERAEAEDDGRGTGTVDFIS